MPPEHNAEARRWFVKAWNDLRAGVEEAREALALAREVYDAVLCRLPEEVRP